MDRGHPRSVLRDVLQLFSPKIMAQRRRGRTTEQAKAPACDADMKKTKMKRWRREICDCQSDQTLHTR